jgi:hypothetical protein
LSSILRSGIDFKLMASFTEQALRRLNFEFLKNGTENLTEFEVTSPRYFRIVIRPDSNYKGRSLFLPILANSKGSTIYFGLDDTQLTSIAEFHSAIAQVVKTLVSTLPNDPWDGLKRDWGREKRRWKSLLKVQ